MAEKTLMTRIVNKHADLATWNSSTLPLKTGEIALARVETTKPDGHGGFYTVPTYLMKVGDGEKTFSQLEWLAAPASDVYQWAKASVKPSYNATEITRGSSTVATDLKAAEDAIKALQTAVGGDSVTTMIQEAINALDNNDAAVDHQFVTAAVQTDGTVAVTRRALTAEDIPALEIAKITGLQTALDLKATKTEVEQGDNAIKATIGSSSDAAGAATVYGAIATAKKAGDDAKDALDAYKLSNDEALAEVKATAEAARTEEEVNSQIDAKISTFKTTTVDPISERVTNNATNISGLAGAGRTTETVKGNADAIAKLREDIGNVANIMNFRGVSSSDVVGEDITDPVNGDVIIHGDAEYVYNVVEGVGTWVKFGDASDNAAAISALQNRVTTAEQDIDNIEVRLSETGDITTAIAAAKKAADDAQADADTANAAIAVINGDGEGSIAKAVADEAAKRQAADKAINDTIGGAFDSTNTVAKAITAAADAASAAQTAIDTHKSAETAHTKAQVGLGKVDNKSVAEIKTEFTGSVADNNTGFVTGDSVYDAIEAAKTDAATTAQGKVDALANGAVKTNTQNIANNATDISTIKNTYVRVDGDALVYGQTGVGDGVMTIVFDCGGAE